MDRVRSTLKSMPGVLDYEVGVEDNSLRIVFQERVTTPEKIIGQLADKGYQVAGQPLVSKDLCH
jgi:copper chaperone CopZ